MTGFRFIASIVAMLHVAALSFAFGPRHGKYLLVKVISGAILWGLIPALIPLRRYSGLLIGAGVALVLQ